MPSIKERIAALSKQLQCGKRSFREIPFEELDPISQSIRELLEELDDLDTPEKKAVYCDRYDMDLDSLEKFIRTLDG